MVNSIFVTGITGFIGSNLLQSLLSSHKYVVNFSKNNVINEYSKEQVRIIDNDNFDESKYDAKVFINLATNYNPSPRNINELKNIINSNIFFLVSLTNEVNILNSLKLINPSSYLQLLDPSLQNEYSLSKQVFIKFARSIFREINNIHIFDTFGLKDNRNKVVDVFIKKIIKNESIIIPKNEIHINLSIVDDVTHSILNCIDEVHSEDLVIRSENNISLNDLIQKLFDLMGRRVEVIRKGNALDYISYVNKNIKNIYEKHSPLTFDEQLEKQIQSHL